MAGDRARSSPLAGHRGVTRSPELRALPPAERAKDFDQVFRGEYAAILRLATVLVRSAPVGEELTQEAFVRLHRTFDDVVNPAGFLRTVVVRLASTWRTRAAMEQERLARLAPQADASIDEIDEIDETWEALGRLRPERSTVLVLRFYEDMSNEDIARVLGCSAGTVRSRVRRALSDLREELS